MEQLKINIGSGCVHLPGYLRVDCDKSLSPDICCSVEELSAHIAPGTVDEARAYHIIEHISQGIPLFRSLRQIWLCLKPGGLLDIAVPDCAWAMRQFATDSIDLDEAEQIIMGSDNDATEYMLHRTMFDIRKLTRYLHITGYTDITETSLTPGEIRMTASRPQDPSDPSDQTDLLSPSGGPPE